MQAQQKAGQQEGQQPNISPCFLSRAHNQMIEPANIHGVKITAGHEDLTRKISGQSSHLIDKRMYMCKSKPETGFIHCRTSGVETYPLFCLRMKIVKSLSR